LQWLQTGVEWEGMDFGSGAGGGLELDDDDGNVVISVSSIELVVLLHH